MARITILPTALMLARQLSRTDEDLASALILAGEDEPAWTDIGRQLQQSGAISSGKTTWHTAPVGPELPDTTTLGKEQSAQHELRHTDPASSTIESIPNPPIPGEPAQSINALFAEVNAFAKSHGFGIIKANGVVRPGHRSRYVFQCDRYGAPRPGRGAGIRKRKSRKSGCQWKIIAETLPENGFYWTLRQFPNTEHHEHNHEPSADAAAHPVHRRLTSPVKAIVQSSSRRIGIRARDIGGIVRDHFPDSVYTPTDIYNARARISRENLGGYGSTAALIKLFDDKEIPYIAEWADDEPDRLIGLVWTFPYCIRMWRRFSEVVSFDNTYNTNRFKLPLFQVTGQTCLGTVFNAAFGLIDNERLEDIRAPDVIVTDFDKQMKQALGVEFPEAQQQICIHHINSNVMLQSKRRWVYTTRDSSTGEESSSDEPDASLNQHDRQAVRASERPEELVAQHNLPEPITHDYHGVLILWRQVVFAETVEDHEKAWKRLCSEFGDQRAILGYLYSTYLPVKEQWARCFIRTYRNFGIRVTSGTEASNNNVKSYLLNGMGHLYRLVEAIQGMLEDQEREFRQACAQDEVLTAREHVGRGSEYLGELPQTVSQKALSYITRERRKPLKGIPNPKNPWPNAIGPCGGSCTVSIELGVPCYHAIYRKLINATRLTKWDVHPRWHLQEPQSDDVYRRILDPKVATSLRGRPRNKP
ncbi:transposase [Pochonia chlamydosporia 170]|uniref:Transposase n=1 Tax=Pochonia chlamydosporia 170 TaxID=1380566 RepID=A0A179F1M9_METCM|nr:transposase [Pochonia chlamydosporia 170]OAQ58993.1 transposase [Pochonia chlamydosporia 170]